MTLFHAVVHTDHHAADIVQFDIDQVLARHLKAHTHDTPQHRSGVRDEHEFFGAVCDALDGIPEVLVTGTHTSIADFERYAVKHRPAIAKHIVGYEVVDQLTEKRCCSRTRAAPVPTSSWKPVAWPR